MGAAAMNVKQIIKRNDVLFNILKNLELKIRYIEIKHFYSFSLKYRFKRRLNYSLNLDDPRTFCEKIQWLKLNYRNQDIIKLTDKVEARKYISELVGDEILIEQYGVYDTVEEIDFTKLPSKFVLKPSHSCGRIIICKDKKSMNWVKEKNKMQRWLKENFFYEAGEWQYKDLKPRIICEKLLQENINDYKIYCFNGKPYCTQVISNRAGESYNSNYYDMDWNLMDIRRKDHKVSKDIISKPVNYDKMLSISRKISEKFPFVRMDFYEVDSKLYFGEATFTPANGMIKFVPDEYDMIFGNLLDISFEKSDSM